MGRPPLELLTHERLARLQLQRREASRLWRKTHASTGSGAHKTRFWVGIDGEGTNRGEPWFYARDRFATNTIVSKAHLYTTLRWTDAKGQGQAIVAPENGLRTERCLSFILDIPREAKIAGYGFGYDLSKILEDLPAELIFKLTHPETRLGFYVAKDGSKIARPEPIFWEGFLLDLLSTRFRVARAIRGRKGRYRALEWRTIFDLVKFYQSGFVSACAKWSVGTQAERDTMQQMKDDRRNLARYSQADVDAYNTLECMWLSTLAEKLDEAHEALDLRLGQAYFGAGSTSKALLKKWGIAENGYAPLPKEVELAALYAFFGGRFELARRGVVKGVIHDYDISSAYPYQLWALPCLDCGTWKATSNVDEVRQAQAALCCYALAPWKGALPPWGPFPFRDKDGTIPFPCESGGGWVHRDEFLAGLALFPNVKLVSAWVYRTSCNHHPFVEIPSVYRERCRIGKDGPGIVLKLGTNAIAGSIMQTVGARRYYHPVWAGMITSGTRAELLRMLGQFEKWSDVIMMATDGLWSTSEARPLTPRDTGTFDLAQPLGGWEHATFQQGVFMARPGIYFPLGITDEKGMKDLKARGIGTRKLFECRDDILEHYRQTHGEVPFIIHDDDPVALIAKGKKTRGLDRFVGLRGGIVRTVETNDKGEVVSTQYRKKSSYGLWSVQSRALAFNALPKRNEGDGHHLEVRRMLQGQFSMPYDKGKISIEELLLENDETHDDDQADFVD